MPTVYASGNHAPLADVLRPSTLAEVAGQSHLLDYGGPLRRALDAGLPRSLLLWGPPGVGKTTLARLCGEAFAGEWMALSAMSARTPALRSVLEHVRLNRSRGRRTLLFIDEIHRLGRREQEYLLPYVAAAELTVIGATTENPSFALLAGLLSLMEVHVLTSLDDQALRRVLRRACERIEPAPSVDASALERLVALSDGDARRVLSLLEQCIAAADDGETIDAGVVDRVLTSNGRRFDKGGDRFYDQISALHKSVRGSHPDAAIYWLCRMLDGGVDLRYLARRILCMAWDDIGLADPRAMRLASDAATCCERFGRPDGELALCQAVIYLAVADKSNAGALAYTQARTLVREDAPRAVPASLRHASPNPLPHALAAAPDPDFWPEGMTGPDWYRPVPRGLEIDIATRMRRLRDRT